MVPPVLHRDLKCANLLLTDEGRLKLGDFGLSRVQAQPGDPMTNNVITLWYRPPELLLGAREYSAAVDMWSVGEWVRREVSVFPRARVLVRHVLFPRQHDL